MVFLGMSYEISSSSFTEKLPKNLALINLSFKGEVDFDLKLIRLESAKKE